MQIAIPLFDRFTALDAVGPYEVLSKLPDSRVDFVAAEPGPVHADTRMLTLVAERSLDEVSAPDVVVVPGGIGSRAAARDERMLAWVRQAHKTSRFTTSVCTGALVLQAAGVLDGIEATTYWACIDELERPVKERFVEQGKVFTAAGVSAGIDMALALVDRLAGEFVAQAIQLGIEYDPAPPFDAGSPDKAPKEAVELIRTLQRAEDEQAAAA